jgi:hypothetical protein
LFYAEKGISISMRTFERKPTVLMIVETSVTLGHIASTFVGYPSLHPISCRILSLSLGSIYIVEHLLRSFCFWRVMMAQLTRIPNLSGDKGESSSPRQIAKVPESAGGNADISRQGCVPCQPILNSRRANLCKVRYILNPLKKFMVSLLRF